MKVIIIGQSWLGEQTLKLCLRLGYDVVKVIAASRDDRLYRSATKAGITTCVCSKSVDGDDMSSGVDLILCAHAHVFITKEARDKVRHGAIGYHPSLLPRHRGRDAVHWTIAMRDPIAGGTVYWMDDGMDTGCIAAQEFCHVLRTDDAATLWRRELAPLGLNLFKRVLSDITEGKVVRIDQDTKAATWEPRISGYTIKKD